MPFYLPPAGDIVIAGRPVAPSESVIKRVMGLAGDQVVLYPDVGHSEVRTVEVSLDSVHSAALQILAAI